MGNVAPEYVGRLRTGDELVRLSFDLAAPSASLTADHASHETWIHCLPKGPDVAARDGRRFRVESLEAIVRETHVPMLIDLEHRSEADDTSAAGWIEEFAIRDDGLWGRASWTPKGREHVATKTYRFLSPVVLGRRGADKVLSVVKLGSVALTNRPALKMRGIEMLRESLSTRFGAFAPDTDEDQTMDKLTKLIREACGLESDATEDDLVAALKPKLRKKKPADDDAAGDQSASLREACNTLTAERNAEKTRADKLETELLSFRSESFKRNVETFFADGSRAGKIQPANRERWMKFATESEANFATFKDVIYPGLPVVGAPQGDGKGGKPAKEKLRGKSATTGIDYDALKAIGLSAKEIREAERQTFRTQGDDGPGDDDDDDADDDDDGDTTDKEGAPAPQPGA